MNSLFLAMKCTCLLFISVAFVLANCKPKDEISSDSAMADLHKNKKWKCNLCDEWHTDLPFAYGPNYPDFYWSIPEEERSQRVVVDSNFCVIDRKYFFVRGRLKIPVLDSDEDFCWDVWVSQSETNFDRTLTMMDTEGRESEPPYFGWLSNNLHLYPETTHLKTRVHTQPVGLTPIIELDYSDHPLAIEQRNGITLARVQEIASLIQHPQHATKTNSENHSE